VAVLFAGYLQSSGVVGQVIGKASGP